MYQILKKEVWLTGQVAGQGNWVKMQVMKVE